MAKTASTPIKVTPTFVGLMTSLSSTALGQTYHIAREGAKIYISKLDEEKGTIIFNMDFDEYLFSFEEKSITFHNIKDFLNALKIQDYGKNQVSISRMEYKDVDTLLIKEGKSKIYHRLSAKDRYSESYGFDEVVDVDAMNADPDLPKRLQTNLTSDQVKEIYEKASKFKPDSISFSKNTDNVSMNFFSTTEKLSEYSFDIDKENISNFDEVEIDSHTVFSYNLFHILRAINCDISLGVYGLKGRYSLGFTGTYLKENISVKFNCSAPSRAC